MRYIFLKRLILYFIIISSVTMTQSDFDELYPGDYKLINKKKLLYWKNNTGN